VRIQSLTRIGLPVIWIWGACVLGGYPTAAQEKPVSVHVKIQVGESDKSSTPTDHASDVVIWLKPLDLAAVKTVAAEQSGKRPQVIQKNKSFQPHLTVVRVGAVVDFPNHDPFFHNVFSLFDGKRFDLGLYEAGATNSVRFDHVGVSYLFCNIHPEMSAVVVAVDTPYYGVSDKSGNIAIGNVPEGRYELHVWYEQSVPEALKTLTRAVHISENARDLGTIVVLQDPGFTPAHKNKYGQEYAPPPKQYSQP
jgi:plastocyanin